MAVFRKANKRPADFHVCRDGADELIECSRLHPGSADLDRAIGGLPGKLHSRVIDKARQIRDSRDALGIPDALGHILVDISEYGAESAGKINHQGTTRQVGFSDDQVEELSASMLHIFEEAPPTGIDVISLCWSTSFQVHSVPTAIIQRARHIRLRSGSPLLDYNGWTIEIYGASQYVAQQVAVSSAARSPAWLKARHYSMSDQLLTWGEPETYEEYLKNQQAADQ